MSTDSQMVTLCTTMFARIPVPSLRILLPHSLHRLAISLSTCIVHIVGMHTLSATADDGGAILHQ
jgi:hypothetical protein